MFVFYSKLWTVKEKFSKIIPAWSLLYFTLFLFFIMLLSPSPHICLDISMGYISERTLFGLSGMFIHLRYSKISSKYLMR